MIHCLHYYFIPPFSLVRARASTGTPSTTPEPTDVPRIGVCSVCNSAFAPQTSFALELLRFSELLALNLQAAGFSARWVSIEERNIEEKKNVLLLLQPLGLQRFAANDITDRAFDLASRGRPATAGVVEVGCGRDRGATRTSTNASGTVLLVGHHTVVVHARARMMVGMCLSGNVVTATANL